MIIKGLSAAVIIFAPVFLSCNASKKTAMHDRSSTNNINEVNKKNMKDSFFNKLFQENAGILDSALKNRDNWNVQVIYTMIDRNINNEPVFTATHTFNKNSKYFYPASTVKLPISLLALQKLNELKGKGINKHTTMLTEAAYSGQSPVVKDSTAPDGKPTIGHYVKKIFMVSDNDAANRLYEFLGQDYLNSALHSKGYVEAHILHRLDIFLSEDDNRHTNPVNFYDSTGKLIYSQPMLFNTRQYERRNDFSGNGFFRNDTLINSPMNFSKKNKISLESLHDMLFGVIFPGKINASRRFNISDEDRNFVLKYMSQFPGESAFPLYDTNEFHDAYAKFILYGSEKGVLPKHVRIFNKVGDAYGQLTDVAYIVDFKNKIEFLVSATIACNRDGIINDDKYDYDSIGFPFMKSLGQALYKYELKRPRNVIPDLSAFVFEYDK